LSIDANGNNPAASGGAAKGDNGIEVWLAVDAGPGEYKVYLQRCMGHRDTKDYTKVDLVVIYRDGYHYETFDEVRLSGDPNSRPPEVAAVVTLTPDGGVALRR
jgi:hypothetical protein